MTDESPTVDDLPELDDEHFLWLYCLAHFPAFDRHGDTIPLDEIADGRSTDTALAVDAMRSSEAGTLPSGEGAPGRYQDREQVKTAYERLRKQAKGGALPYDELERRLLDGAALESGDNALDVESMALLAQTYHEP